MKAYSQDLRERAVASVERGECTVAQAAERFRVSKPSLERWLARQRATGSCAALPHAGGVARKLAVAEKVLRLALKRQPDASLNELCERVATDLKLVSSRSMMCRELARLKLPVKKNRFKPVNAPRRA